MLFANKSSFLYSRCGHRAWAETRLARKEVSAHAQYRPQRHHSHVTSWSWIGAYSVPTVAFRELPSLSPGLWDAISSMPSSSLFAWYQTPQIRPQPNIPAFFCFPGKGMSSEKMYSLPGFLHNRDQNTVYKEALVRPHQVEAVRVRGNQNPVRR